MVDMPSNKKLTSLRLAETDLKRVDTTIERRYAEYPVKPSRNAVLESWVLERLEEEEKKLKDGKK